MAQSVRMVHWQVRCQHLHLDGYNLNGNVVYDRTCKICSCTPGCAKSTSLSITSSSWSKGTKYAASSSIGGMFCCSVGSLIGNSQSLAALALWMLRRSPFGPKLHE